MELEALKKLPFVPHVAGNPFPTRPSTLETDMPQRYTMIQLRASMESDAKLHGGAEALRAKLAFAEEKGSGRNALAQTYFSKRRKNWTSSAPRAVQQEPTLQERVRNRRAAWRAAGVESEDLRWISRAARMRWIEKAPLPFDYGVSLQDATPRQLQWMDAETASGSVRKAEAAKQNQGRNKKKGQWEPTQLVEHLGLEVDLKAGQFRVTRAHLQKIHQQARTLLSEASQQRRWFLWAKAEWHRHTVDRRGPLRKPALLNKVPHKLREEACAATVVAPYRPGQMWFKQLEALADEVVILPRGKDLFTPCKLGGSELGGSELGGSELLGPPISTACFGIESRYEMLCGHRAQSQMQLYSAIHTYIDPTAVPEEHMEWFFRWTTPRWRQQLPGTRQCTL
ncbi:hypothetical protein CYMTET_46659 [Cymbomonas tetramitiformis]|uniref:Uncharacterized protein n=1 Tax=Cymbomonas tetramitiformis TaxID=36881 RepID=A0AAE0BVS5_9CHLO|nr:hypothetical protein CYMTET_46659 [Cymbomonas tetramitiformis]